MPTFPPLSPPRRHIIPVSVSAPQALGPAFSPCSTQQQVRSPVPDSALRSRVGLMQHQTLCKPYPTPGQANHFCQCMHGPHPCFPCVPAAGALTCTRWCAVLLATSQAHHSCDCMHALHSSTGGSMQQPQVVPDAVSCPIPTTPPDHSKPHGSPVPDGVLLCIVGLVQHAAALVVAKCHWRPPPLPAKHSGHLKLYSMVFYCIGRRLTCTRWCAARRSGPCGR